MSNEKEFNEGDIVMSPGGTKAKITDTLRYGWDFWLKGINEDRQGGMDREDLEDYIIISCSKHNVSIWHDERRRYFCPFCEKE